MVYGFPEKNFKLNDDVILEKKSLSRYVSINILETKKLKEYRDVEVAFFGAGWDDLIGPLMVSRHFNNENI